MKTKLLAAAAAVALLSAGPALADDSYADAVAAAKATATASASANVNIYAFWWGPGRNSATATTNQGGYVFGNGAADFLSRDSNAISDSFGSASGVIHAGQNTGANSAVQANSTIAAILGGTAGTTLAETYQGGGVSRNLALGIATVSHNSVDSSFGHMNGFVQLQQNTGANSLMQSNATVAAIVNK